MAISVSKTKPLKYLKKWKRKNKIQEWVRGTEKGCECFKGKRIAVGDAQPGKNVKGTVEQMGAGRWGWGVISGLSCFQCWPPHTWDEAIFCFSLSNYHHSPPLLMATSPGGICLLQLCTKTPNSATETLGWETEVGNFVILEKYLLLKYSEVVFFLVFFF